MYVGGARGVLAVIAVLVAAASAPSSGESLGVLVAEVGAYDVYKVGDSVLYAALDPGGFDYVYNGRLYAVKCYSGDYMFFPVRSLLALYQLIAEEAGVSRSEEGADLVYPQPGVRANKLLEALRSAGVEASQAVVAAFVDERAAWVEVSAPAEAGTIMVPAEAGAAWVEVVVPPGRAGEALARAGVIRGLAEKYSGVGVDFVVVIEAPRPVGMSYSEIRRIGLEVFDALVSEGLPLRSVGATYGFPLIFEVDGLKLRELGMTEEEVLEAIDEALPQPHKALVGFCYYNETITPDIGEARSSIEPPRLAVAALAVLALVATIILARRLQG